MPRPSQKDKILQAAVECFAELGYDATRVRHVAERAGVSEAALYRHFPSMQALAGELYLHHFAAFAAPSPGSLAAAAHATAPAASLPPK
jgi:AcrR family transcriptional regulator